MLSQQVLELYFYEIAPRIVSTKPARSAPSGNQEIKICKQWAVLTWGVVLQFSSAQPPLLSLPNLIPMPLFPSLTLSKHLKPPPLLSTPLPPISVPLFILADRTPVLKAVQIQLPLPH